MNIQLERIWLFETNITDPFIFNKTDGVDITMNSTDDRVIELIDIDTAIYYIDTIAKGGLNRVVSYGGEDHFPVSNNGKVSFKHSISFNVPVYENQTLEQLVGKEFSMVGMRRDLSQFACFGRFVCKKLNIDNELINRVTLDSNTGNQSLFELNSINITEVINVIGDIPAAVLTPEIQPLNFPYPMGSGLN
jgi:hypothetical protein